MNAAPRRASWVQTICNLIAVAICLCIQSAFGAAAAHDMPPLHNSWHAIETARFAWRSGASAYKFIVEEGPGDRRLRIIDPDGAVHIISVEGGFVTIVDGLAEPALANDNLLKSKYAYLSPKLRNARNEPLLIGFGWAFASDPGSIRVIGLDARGIPRVIFSDDTFRLFAIGDLDGRGRPDLIGIRSVSESVNGCVRTYDPFSVLRFATNGRLRYSLSLSKAYNLAHYYGWAGPKYRDDIVVVTCPNAPARIMDSKRAEALYGK